MQSKVLEIDYVNEILGEFLKNHIILYTVPSMHCLEIYHLEVAFINKK